MSEIKNLVDGEIINLSEEEIKDVIENNNIIPNRGKVIITCNSIEYEEGDLETDLTMLSDIQTVVAVSDNNTFVKSGDKVILDLESLKVPVTGVRDSFEENYQLNIDYVMSGGYMLSMINERNIKAKIV